LILKYLLPLICQNYKKMSYQQDRMNSSQPLNEKVVGMFCYPKPFAPGGTISIDEGGQRPLIIGTDVFITADGGGGFSLDIIVDISEWGVNIGDYINFSTPELSGSYRITNTDAFPIIITTGPGQEIASGVIWFSKISQKITGAGTKFTKTVTVGRWIIVMDQASSITVQACKVAKIVSDTELFVEKGFVTPITLQPFMIPSGVIRGVSINCVGGGVVMGQNVDAGDILTFYQDSGLEPVYGDSGESEFKILIQK
jgi:hypothetical protein